MDKSRILIIEDSEPVRRLLTMVLSMAGQTVVAYANSYQARQAIADQVFDLAVLGLSAGQSEAEALRVGLRADSPADTVPVIYLTANGRLDTQASPEPLLHKPFGVADLLAAVERSLPNPLAPVAAHPESFPSANKRVQARDQAAGSALVSRWQDVLAGDHGDLEVSHLQELPQGLQAQLDRCIFLLEGLCGADEDEQSTGWQDKLMAAWQTVGLLLAEYKLPAFQVATTVVDLLRHRGMFSPTTCRPGGGDDGGKGSRCCVLDRLPTEIVSSAMTAYLVYKDAQLAMQAEAVEWLSAEVSQAHEEERRQLSLEIHDDIAQVLGNLVLLSDVSLAQAPRRNRELRDTLLRLKGIARDAFRRARNFSLDLRPPMLDDLGLIPTVAWYVERFSQEYGVPIQLHIADRLAPAPTQIETALFRIMQEALTNVRKHARAASVRVTLEKRDHHLRLMVADDGQGFDLAVAQSGGQNGEHLGLSGMHYRMRLVSGYLRVISQPGYGTTVIAEAPLPRRENHLASVA